MQTNIDKQERAREKQKRIFLWSEKEKHESDRHFLERGGQARERQKRMQRCAAATRGKSCVDYFGCSVAPLHHAVRVSLGGTMVAELPGRTAFKRGGNDEK